MKKPASPVQTEKRAKRTPEEKSARKSAKDAGHATSDLNDERDTKKASQKKSLKSAAKQLQKELNSRMNEVVARIRKETKAKLKEVVKEATRRLDGDTERMFEQALHTIVRHYDSVSGITSAANGNEGNPAPAAAKSSASRGNKKGKTLNKDGSPRKARATRETVVAAEAESATPAPKTRGRKAGTTAPAAAVASARTAKPSPSGARRGPKPRTQAAPETTEVSNPADSASASEASE